MGSAYNCAISFIEKELSNFRRRSDKEKYLESCFSEIVIIEQSRVSVEPVIIETFSVDINEYNMEDPQLLREWIIDKQDDIFKTIKKYPLRQYWNDSTSEMERQFEILKDRGIINYKSFNDILDGKEVIPDINAQYPVIMILCLFFYWFNENIVNKPFQYLLLMMKCFTYDDGKLFDNRRLEKPISNGTLRITDDDPEDDKHKDYKNFKKILKKP